MRKTFGFIVLGFMLTSLFSCSVVRRDKLHPEWKAQFDSLGVHGGIVIFDEGKRTMHVYNPGRIDSAFLPASTFKIPNSLISLQVGAVADTSEVVPWDSVDRVFKAWNRDHNMASALPVSALWFYQEMARRVGAETMRSYLDTLRYGNRDTTDIDMFWLNNTLKITPREQITFLEKVYHERVPFEKRHIDAVKKMLILKKTDSYTLMGKTGWGDIVEPNIGWLVGWLETKENVYHYALNIDIVDSKDRYARRKIVDNVFKEMGVISE
ncbi:MAG: class D beta-lactamase [Bacteroidia bacterium]|nr:class D beta-lactamase [Bacteroidia bacterium]